MKTRYARLHDNGRNFAVEYFDGTNTEWIRFSRRHLAEAACKAIELRIADTVPVTVRVFVDRWIELHVLVNTGDASQTYLRLIRELVEFLGDELLENVSEADIMSFINMKRSVGMKDRQITPILNIWSSLFGTAVKWGYLSRNPVSGIDGLLLGTQPSLTI